MTWNPQQNPYQNPNSGFAKPPGPVVPADVSTKLTPPGIALLSVGAIGFIGGCIYLVLTLIGLGDANIPVPDDPDERTGFYIGFYGAIIGMAFNVLAQFVVMAGGFAMFKRSSYALALAGCIAALIPCTSSCCLLGVPFGIWGIVVLNSSGVKQAF